MQLIDIREITGRITLRSGLHIGSGDTDMRIGGTDNPIIKHPHTHEPYIPGSSIKGKVRSLLELKSGLMRKTKGAPLLPSNLKGLQENELKEGRRILQLFGSSGSEAESIAELGPTRTSFADCHISEKFRSTAQAKRLVLVEVKSENSINRIKGTAENPRFTERIPAGVEFDFSVYLKVLSEDEDALFVMLLQGLKLLELDALGGSGSRGYGKLRFLFDNELLQKQFDNLSLFT